MKVNHFYRKGFTLAEVLITLGIIGVVCALTIPSLMQKTQDKELRTAWKKAYSELSQAQEQLNQDYSGNMYGECNDFDDKCLRDLFVTKIKTIKSCDSDAVTNGCQANSIFLDGSTTGDLKINDTHWPTIITASAYSIKFRFHLKDCIPDGGGYTGLPCGWMQVDVNGLKKPNVAGKDIFFINLLKYRLRPYDRPKCTDDETPLKTTAEIDQDCLNGTGMACSAKYLSE